jgi:nitrogen fixation-related uncharacterized protein
MAFVALRLLLSVGIMLGRVIVRVVVWAAEGNPD